MKRLLALATLSCAMPSYATPYLGADFQYRSVNLRGLNAHVFAKRAPAMNLYGGIMLNDDLAFEVGFHSAKQTKKFPGMSGASLKMKGIHGALVAYYPLTADGKFKALGGAGLAQLRHHARHPAYRLDLSRCVPRLIGGVEYAFTDAIGVRASFVWESAKSMKKKNDQSFNNVYAFGAGLKMVF